MTPASHFTHTPTADLTRIEDLTRREFMFSALGAALLIACGDDQDGDTASEDATRTINDVYGPVTVPAVPQRVVSFDAPTLTMLAALGVKPVGTYVNPLTGPPPGIDMAGVANVTAGENEIDLEGVLGLDPDLIVMSVGNPGNHRHRELYDQVKREIPTFGWEFAYAYIEDLRSNLGHVALAVGREAQAQALLARYEARVAELRESVKAAGFDQHPVSTVRVRAGGDYSIRIGTSESIVYRALGIPQPEGQRNPDDFSIELSAENLSVLDQAYALVVWVDEGGPTPESLLDEPVWSLLRPVQEGRVVFVDRSLWNNSDFLSLMAIMDDIEEKLLPLGGN